MDKKQKKQNSFQEEFLDKLIQKAWFSKEDWVLLKADLRPILQERIMLYIYKELDENWAKKVSSLLGQEKYDELTKFLESTIPNYDDFIMEIYAQFEDEYLENFK